jgi:hypothetical protein
MADPAPPLTADALKSLLSDRFQDKIGGLDILRARRRNVGCREYSSQFDQ